jgi:hypothetical protein
VTAGNKLGSARVSASSKASPTVAGVATITVVARPAPASAP